LKGTVIKYNESFPYGKRVIYCSINGKLLDEKSTYKILTNNFLAEGGDGFLAFKKATAKKDTHIEVIQTMIEYMKTFDTYNPRLQGRVVKVKE